MIRKILCCLLAAMMCVSLLGGCAAGRYVYTDTDIGILCDGYDMYAYPSPTSDEEYMLWRLRGASLIFEGVILETEYKRNNPGNDHYPTLLSTIAVTDVWYGKSSDKEIVLEHSFNMIGQDRYAPQKGDHVVIFLVQHTKGGNVMMPTMYETFFILNPPDDMLIPLHTFEKPSSLAGKPKEELRSAIKETLDDIADGKVEPMSAPDGCLDIITDKYVKKYERRQKWKKLFSLSKEN